jgi:hypothetical protein
VETQPKGEVRVPQQRSDKIRTWRLVSKIDTSTHPLNSEILIPPEELKIENFEVHLKFCTSALFSDVFMREVIVNGINCAALRKISHIKCNSSFRETQAIFLYEICSLSEVRSI